MKLKKQSALISRLKEVNVKKLVDRNNIKGFRLQSIGVRLFSYFFLVIVLSVAIVGFLSYNQSYRLIEDQASESQRLTAIQAAEKMRLVLERYQSQAVEVSLLPEIKELPVVYQLYPDDFLKQMELNSQVKSRFSNSIISDNTIASIHVMPMNRSMMDISIGEAMKFDDIQSTEWFKSATELTGFGNGIWVPTMPNGPDGKRSYPSFGYAMPIRIGGASEIDFMYFMEIKETRLQEVMAGAFGAGSKMYLLDQEGNIISAEMKEEISQPFPVQLSSANGATTEEMDGQTMIIAHSELPGGWKLVGVQPLAPLVEGAGLIRTLTYIMLLFGVVVAVVIGWLVALQIGTPLRRIGALMKRAEEGELSVEAPFGKRKDEIGDLSRSFNEMMSNIRALVKESHESVSQVMNTASELSEASKRTATSAKEISIATEQIAVGASNVAVEAEKVTDVTAVMGSRMSSTVEANEQMSAAAQEIRNSTEQGAAYMQELSAKTGETERLTFSVVKKVEELQKSTSSIQQILVMLDNITKQTNILSLNATIEAARAGDAGRGFMVVADEIRKLADQSKQSIETVGRITDTIRGEIEDTVGLMGQAYPMFQQQIESVKQSNEIFLSVNDKIGEFVTQLDTVKESVLQLEETQRTLSDAMASVSAVAQQSSATSEEVAGLTTEQLQVGESLVGLAGSLEDVSVRLRDTLNKFKL